MKTTMKRYALVCATLMLSAAAAQATGILTSKDGMTLYVFDKDKDGISSCYDKCAEPTGDAC